MGNVCVFLCLCWREIREERRDQKMRGEGEIRETQNEKGKKRAGGRREKERERVKEKRIKK